ncbi:hypothetical protein NZ47_08420 [Anaerovibrio lipolyticus]|uniref:Uncharacterized protein n=2 Tax=Anaerovibrio lipolyticus TaxID=82374 RepID=A0A0B2JYK9_9FIRM|nr:hypothetical protein NZ47_08420 [Anaerovibrio lipolyticus]
MQGKPDTPKETITELYSGKLKNVDDINAIITNYYRLGKIDCGDEVYHAFGFKSRKDYNNAFFNKILNIDHAENLNVVDLGYTFYRVNGTIHFKDGSTEYLNNKILSVVGGETEDKDPQSEMGRLLKKIASTIFPNLFDAKFRINIAPVAAQIGKKGYWVNSSRNGEHLLNIDFETYYQGDSICFIAYIENLTDDEYILADWPNGANVIWGGKSERLLNPVIIRSKDNPIGTRIVEKKENISELPRKEDKKYHAVIASSFSLDRVVSLQEATNILLWDNNKLTINYFTLGENGLPSLSAPKDSWEFEWTYDKWQYASGEPLRPSYLK